MCSDIPGFKNLGTGEQALLMEAAYFDIWMVSSAHAHRHPSPLLHSRLAARTFC